MTAAALSATMARILGVRVAEVEAGGDGLPEARERADRPDLPEVGAEDGAGDADRVDVGPEVILARGLELRPVEEEGERVLDVGAHVGELRASSSEAPTMSSGWVKISRSMPRRRASAKTILVSDTWMWPLASAIPVAATMSRMSSSSDLSLRSRRRAAPGGVAHLLSRGRV